MKPLKQPMRLAAALLIGTALSLVLGAPAVLAAGGAYMLKAGYVASHTMVMPGVTFDITISSSTIIAEAQTYFRAGGHAMSDIQTAVKDKRDLPSFAKKRIVQGDIVELSSGEITSVLQTFKKRWSPKGDVTLTPVPFRLRRIKGDVDLDPDEVASTYYGFLADLAQEDRSKWPVVRYIMEVLMAQAWGKDQSDTDWAGEYVAATNDDVAGPTLGSYDGLKTIVTKGLDVDGTMNELQLDYDITSASQVFQAMEQIVDKLPQQYQSEDMLVICSPKIKLNYFRDRRNTHGSDMDYNQKNNIMNMTLDGLPNMAIQPMNGIGAAGDHGWVIVTPRRNVLIGERMNSYNMGIEKARRGVSVLFDYTEGIGVGLAEEVFVVRPSDDSSS